MPASIQAAEIFMPGRYEGQDWTSADLHAIVANFHRFADRLPAGVKVGHEEISVFSEDGKPCGKVSDLWIDEASITSSSVDSRGLAFLCWGQLGSASQLARSFPSRAVQLERLRVREDDHDSRNRGHLRDRAAGSPRSDPAGFRRHPPSV